MNFDTVEVVVDKLVRTFNLREYQYDLENLVEDIAEALKLIGAAKLFEEGVHVGTVNGRVVRLPLDCENIKHVNTESQYYRESGSFIEIDLPDGTEVSIVYQKMPTDSRGYVMVPDNAPLREAVMWYLVKNLVLQGQIKSVNFQMAEGEWQWRCGSARADLTVLNLQQANRVYNDFTRLNPIKDAHANDYKDIGKSNNTFDREKLLNNPKR